MKSRDLWIAIIFIVLAVGLYFYQKESFVSTNELAPAALSAVESSPVVSLAAAEKTDLSGVPQLPSRATGEIRNLEGYPFRLPDKSLAEFRSVEGGYAIAFGDIILGKIPKGVNADRGVFEVPKGRLWRSNRIPYIIHPDVKNVKAIDEAIAYLEANTPIRLVPAQGDKDVVVFLPAEEYCASYLGYLGGQQPILVAPSCKRGELIHEVMHTLGFVHEQSRVDRDQYVEIVWDNIKEDFYNQFHIVPEAMTNEYRGAAFEFDYQSLMLYPATAFAKTTSLETMKSRTAQAIQPERESLSKIDLERLYYLYGH